MKFGFSISSGLLLIRDGGALIGIGLNGHPLSILSLCNRLYESAVSIRGS